MLGAGHAERQARAADHREQEQVHEDPNALARRPSRPGGATPAPRAHGLVLEHERVREEAIQRKRVEQLYVGLKAAVRVEEAVVRDVGGKVQARARVLDVQQLADAQRHERAEPSCACWMSRHLSERIWWMKRSMACLATLPELSEMT